MLTMKFSRKLNSPRVSFGLASLARLLQPEKSPQNGGCLDL